MWFSNTLEKLIISMCDIYDIKQSMPTNLDMDCLRTFVAIIELGSFAEASRLVGRTPSAVSLQVRRLEERVGAVLFQREGRRMIPNPEGERLFTTARQILQLNDSIVDEFAFPRLSGEVSLGAIQDIADTVLPEILTRFDRAYPKVRISVKVDRTKFLAEAVGKGDLDLAIGVHGWSRKKDHAIRREQMIWIGGETMRLEPDAPVPLILFEPPCSFRDAAINALNQAGKDWDIVYTSPSLSGLRAAVQAGLGVTARTVLLISSGVKALPKSTGLPKLPSIEFGLYEGSSLAGASLQMKAQVLKVVAGPYHD